MRGEYWTHAILDSLRAVDACSLSPILVTGSVPQRYFLTSEACTGLLRQVGMWLPKEAERVLRAQARRRRLSRSKATQSAAD